MSSDATVLTKTVTRCGWPGCPSSFISAPMTKGWTKIPLGAALSPLTLCPFHAVGHIPRMIEQIPKATALCSCEQMIPLERFTPLEAITDWQRHAREINAQSSLMTCQECRRGFTPGTTDRVRRHNMWDKMAGRLLPIQCPGSGLPSVEQVQL